MGKHAHQGERPRRSRRDIEIRPSLAGTVIGLACLVSLLAPLIAPFDPLKPDFNRILAPPGVPYILGTDELGRDILSRLLWGGRPSLTVTAGAVLLAALIGVPTGLVAGYYGGLVDFFLMRITDLAMAFPAIVLAMAIVSFFSPSLGNLILVIGFLYIPRFVRLTYASTLTLKKTPFVEASRAIGASDARILVRDLLPNILPVILVQTSLALGFGFLLESSISFIGIGVQPPTPSWGLMIADARNVMARSPFYILWPSAAITAMILAFNSAGDFLRDRLDPRLRGV